MLKQITLACLLFLSMIVCASSQPIEDNQVVHVDKKIVILLDNSGSMDKKIYKDETVFDWQVKGYVAALQDSRIISAIKSEKYGQVAIIVVTFNNRPEINIDWTLVNASNISSFINEFKKLNGLKRPDTASTSIGNGLDFSKDLIIESTNIQASQTIILVSGDGVNNGGVEPYPLSEEIAEYLKVTIIGVYFDKGSQPLAESTIGPFYFTNIAKGVGSFVMEAKTPEVFTDALIRLFTLRGTQ